MRREHRRLAERHAERHAVEQTLGMALGIMVVPSNGAMRRAARATWLADAAEHAAVRFVAGDVPCARSALEAEAERFGDVAFVESDDCKKWHSPAKVHAWYIHALARWPKAVWIAKMEDDGLLWTSALARELATVRERGPNHAWYVGMMQWQGGCTLNEERRPAGAPSGPAGGTAVAAAGAEYQGCAGCWGGWYRGGAPAPAACAPMWRKSWVGSVVQGTPSCPQFRLAPFACGPFEARSRPLAQAVARCAYAGRYFAAMSRRGDLKKDWCVSADGAQGHALGHCVRSVRIADLGPHRQKYATPKQLNESHEVLIVHPIKTRGRERTAEGTQAYVEGWKDVWRTLRRAPYAPAASFSGPGLMLSRLWALNETRPRTERTAARVAGAGPGGSREHAKEPRAGPPRKSPAAGRAPHHRPPLVGKPLRGGVDPSKSV